MLYTKHVAEGHPEYTEEGVATAVTRDIPYVLPGKTKEEVIQNVCQYVSTNLDVAHTGTVTEVMFRSMWTRVHHEMFDIEKIECGTGDEELKLGCSVM
jgi:hypothetical protein